MSFEQLQERTAGHTRRLRNNLVALCLAVIALGWSLTLFAALAVAHGL